MTVEIGSNRPAGENVLKMDGWIFFLEHSIQTSCHTFIIVYLVTDVAAQYRLPSMLILVFEKGATWWEKSNLACRMFKKK